jgi:catechol 2,3-dioxygenase-like lactoylglutathione lyase family enzyme
VIGDDRPMNVSFVSSVAVIAPDPPASRRLFADALGLPLQSEGDSEYAHSEAVDGVRHFGVWPLSEAATACFGTPEWPAGRPVPQLSIEFDVEEVAAVQAAADELRAQGFDVLHDAREEPWGQTVARLQSADGAVVGVSFAPWMH